MNTSKHHLILAGLSMQSGRQMNYLYIFQNSLTDSLFWKTQKLFKLFWIKLQLSLILILLNGKFNTYLNPLLLVFLNKRIRELEEK